MLSHPAEVFTIVIGAALCLAGKCHCICCSTVVAATSCLAGRWNFICCSTAVGAASRLAGRWNCCCCYSVQECWSQDPSKRPGFEHIIILIRGLLEGAVSKQKVQKTLTGSSLQQQNPNRNLLQGASLGLPHFALGICNQASLHIQSSAKGYIPLPLYQQA